MLREEDLGFRYLGRSFKCIIYIVSYLTFLSFSFYSLNKDIICNTFLFILESFCGVRGRVVYIGSAVGYVR